jgi:hypothetical protein
LPRGLLEFRENETVGEQKLKIENKSYKKKENQEKERKSQLTFKLLCSTIFCVAC